MNKTEEDNKRNKNREIGYSKPVLRFIFELVKITFISLAIIIPVRYFLVQPFYVKGASMEPSFYDHEYLIINEINYRFAKPERGDVIVFRYPLDPSQYFIKRIVGMPGERIKIEKGRVKIFNQKYPEGIFLDESNYLLPGTRTPGKIDVTLQENEYFVLGDNRNSSLDSRGFGPVPKENIVGKAWFRGWPVERIGVFKKPIYNL